MKTFIHLSLWMKKAGIGLLSADCRKSALRRPHLHLIILYFLLRLGTFHTSLGPQKGFEILRKRYRRLYVWASQVVIRCRRLNLWLSRLHLCVRRLCIWLRHLCICDRRLCIWLRRLNLCYSFLSYKPSLPDFCDGFLCLWTRCLHQCVSLLLHDPVTVSFLRSRFLPRKFHLRYDHVTHTVQVTVEPYMKTRLAGEDSLAERHPLPAYGP